VESVAHQFLNAHRIVYIEMTKEMSCAVLGMRDQQTSFHLRQPKERKQRMRNNDDNEG